MVSPTGRLVLIRGYAEASLVEAATGRDLGRLRSDVGFESKFAFGADDATLLSWEPLRFDRKGAIDVYRIELPKDLAPPPPDAAPRGK